MGGQLDVQSAPGLGTTMRVSFPRHGATVELTNGSATGIAAAPARTPVGAVQLDAVQP